MSLTPQSELRIGIVAALVQLGGKATRVVALNQLGDVMGHLFTKDDRSEVKSHPGEEKWQNRASFERANMVRDGILTKRADGIWELSPLGRHGYNQ